MQMAGIDETKRKTLLFFFSSTQIVDVTTGRILLMIVSLCRRYSCMLLLKLNTCIVSVAMFDNH